ncbi:MAG: hypothetical protein UX74_C0014G0018 [Parcubacteria group bacterium GW2011_GWA2_47_10b]|nr:MAG: hypothetical protein UX74_C0014G0018 [Parcubacteria group bacterium GW2011_GWA2_47_10b]KKU86042.1 MAG: hypothetical protein UY14_C0008G0016 [Parcubacteria group bacterium GW2011_GWA1_47_9]
MIFVLAFLYFVFKVQSISQYFRLTLEHSRNERIVTIFQKKTLHTQKKPRGFFSEFT